MARAAGGARWLAPAAVVLAALPALASATTAAAPDAAEAPRFNNSRCPAFWELQAPHVPTDFRLEDMEGFFYELAFHDVTQFPMCITPPRCITSSKAVRRHSDGVPYVNDSWALNCFGHPYPVELLFNATEYPGALQGYVPLLRRLPALPKAVESAVFPDTVVDFKTGPEGWVLEMQCVEWHEHVVFVGINYYSKTKTEAAFREIDAAARAQGLSFWLDSGFGLSRVDHSRCAEEPGMMQLFV